MIIDLENVNLHSMLSLCEHPPTQLQLQYDS